MRSVSSSTSRKSSIVSFISLTCQLALQTMFHTPLAYFPYPPRPIFTRFREPTSSEVESGTASPGALLPETSFYKNAYAMVSPYPHPCALVYHHPIVVCRPDILPSAILLPCHKTEHHTPLFNRTDYLCPVFICSGGSCARGPAGNSKVGDLASECCRRRIVLGCEVGGKYT